MAKDTPTATTSGATLSQTGWHIHTLLHQLWSTGWNEKWLSFYMHHPTDRMAHTYFVTPVVEHWLEREMAQFLYAPPHRQDGTYILYYTSCGALAGTRNGSIFICTTPQTGWHIHTLLHQLWSTGWNEKWLNFYMHHPTDRMAHTYFVTPVVEHWLKQEIA